MIGRQVGKMIVTEYNPDTKSCVCTCLCGSGKIFVFDKAVLSKNPNLHCGCESKPFVEEALLWYLYEIQGLSINKISEQLGKNRNTISKYLHLYNLNKKIPTRKDLERLYIQEHRSVREISDILGFSMRVLYLWISKYGLREERHMDSAEKCKPKKKGGKKGPKSRVLLSRSCHELKPIDYQEDGTVKCLCSCGSSSDVPVQKLYNRRVKDCGCQVSHELERNWITELLRECAVEYILGYRTLKSRHPHDFALFSDGHLRFFINVVERPRNCKCESEVPILHIPRTNRSDIEGMVLPVIEYVNPGSTKHRKRRE